MDFELFEWDEEKNLYNKRVHKISFEAAAAVFDDDNRLDIYDGKHSLFEDRYKTIGAINGYITIVTVIYTKRKQVTRIISARKANKKEREEYYDR